MSHAMEPVSVPPQSMVDAYFAAVQSAPKLDTEHVESWGKCSYTGHVLSPSKELGEAMDRVPALTAGRSRVGRTHWRSYGVVERYRCDGAQTVIVTMGSMCGTAREAVDLLRDAGHAVGLLKIRLFRPLPVQAITESLVGVDQVVVLDRNYSPGHGGVLHQGIARRALRRQDFAGHSRFAVRRGRCERPRRYIVNFIQQMREARVGPNRNG